MNGFFGFEEDFRDTMRAGVNGDIAKKVFQRIAIMLTTKSRPGRTFKFRSVFMNLKRF